MNMDMDGRTSLGISRPIIYIYFFRAYIYTQLLNRQARGLTHAFENTDVNTTDLLPPPRLPSSPGWLRCGT